MWRNTDVVEFVEWLREYNEARPPGAARIGFYRPRPLQSSRASMEAVVQYLDTVDPEAGQTGAASLMPASITSATTPQTYGYRGGLRHGEVVRGRGGQPASGATTPARPGTRARWPDGGG